MKSISLKTKIVTGLLTGGMLLSSVSLAFGTTAKPLNTEKSAPFKNECRQRQHKGNLKAILKVSVSSKIITQAESDKILAYQKTKIKTLDKKEMKKMQKSDFFKELVDKGILTQVKADSLKASINAQRDIARQQKLDANLKRLVTDKTITENQSVKIKDTIIKAQAARKVEFEKIKNMTEAQRKAYRGINKINHVNPLKSLVDNGTITQAQADKMNFGGHGKHMGAGRHMKGIQNN